MEWEAIPGNKYAIRSKCGRYTVSKAYTAEKTLYRPWCGQRPLGGCSEDAETAKSVCQQHAMRDTAQTA